MRKNKEKTRIMKRGLTTCLLAFLLLQSCYVIRSSSGGGQKASGIRQAPDPSSIALPEGYRIEAVATGLTFPTGIAFDEAGTPYVTESGYAYGEVFTERHATAWVPDQVPGETRAWNNASF